MKRAAVMVTIALLAALAVASALIVAYGQSPGRVYAVMLSHTWGDAYGFGQMLFKATPLLFTGLAVALAFHAGLFNIGCEGQLVVGGFAAALVGTWLPPGLPALLGVPVALAAGAAAGGALGGIPGWLKARFGAHEVINTIMLNFIAQALVLWAGRSFFFVAQTVHTRPISPGARLPSLGLAESAANLGIVIAVVAAAGVWWLLHATRVGYEMRAVGKNPLAAEAGGVRVPRVVITTMALSGALAGLAGATTAVGYKGYFEDGMASGAGFMGIAVALLCRNNPLGVIAAALLFGTLSQGGLAVNAMVPKELVEVIQAVIILVVTVAAAELRRLAPDRAEQP